MCSEKKTKKLKNKNKQKQKTKKVMQPITFLVIASHKPGYMQSDLLLGDLGDQMYHFIHLTLRLFSRNTTVRMRT